VLFIGLCLHMFSNYNHRRSPSVAPSGFSNRTYHPVLFIGVRLPCFSEVEVFFIGVILELVFQLIPEEVRRGGSHIR